MSSSPPAPWEFYLFDPGMDQRADPPLASDLLANELVREIRERVESVGGTQCIRMPRICAGDTVGLVLTLGALSSLGADGVRWIGHKTIEFFKARGRGASGDINALLSVAIDHLSQHHPEVEPDMDAIESFGERRPPGPAREIQAVYLYRIRDTRSTRVFLIEVTSNSRLISLHERERVVW